MASTSATFYFKPIAKLSVSAATNATFYFLFRALTGRYSGVGITRSKDTRNLKTMLPSAAAPIGYVDVDGKRLPVQVDPVAWYAYFRYQTETVLGGANGATLPDVAAAITADQAIAIAGSVVASALAQQANTNAQSIAAAIEVVRGAALPGAEQIPLPQLTTGDLGTGGGGGD